MVYFRYISSMYRGYWVFFTNLSCTLHQDCDFVYQVEDVLAAAKNIQNYQ